MLLYISVFYGIIVCCCEVDTNISIGARCIVLCMLVELRLFY